MVSSHRIQWLWFVCQYAPSTPSPVVALKHILMSWLSSHRLWVANICSQCEFKLQNLVAIHTLLPHEVVKGSTPSLSTPSHDERLAVVKAFEVTLAIEERRLPFSGILELVPADEGPPKIEARRICGVDEELQDNHAIHWSYFPVLYLFYRLWAQICSCCPCLCVRCGPHFNSSSRWNLHATICYSRHSSRTTSWERQIHQGRSTRGLRGSGPIRKPFNHLHLSVPFSSLLWYECNTKSPPSKHLLK